jgi:hypothetical protein
MTKGLSSWRTLALAYSSEYWLTGHARSRQELVEMV